MWCHPETGNSGPRAMVRKAGGKLSTKDLGVMGDLPQAQRRHSGCA